MRGTQPQTTPLINYTCLHHCSINAGLININAHAITTTKNLLAINSPNNHRPHPPTPRNKLILTHMCVATIDGFIGVRGAPPIVARSQHFLNGSSARRKKWKEMDKWFFLSMIASLPFLCLSVLYLSLFLFLSLHLFFYPIFPLVLNF